MTPMTNNETPEIITVIAADQSFSARIDNLLDDSRQTRLLRRTLLAIVALVVVFVVWAVFAQVDELARARGDIQPSEGVQTLQIEEGGSIVKLLVREGETVSQGQPLVEFAATNLNKEKEQNQVKLTSSLIDRERLGALLENRQPVFTSYMKYPHLVQQARTSYEIQDAQRKSLAEAKRSAITQQQRLISGMQRDKGLLASELSEARSRLARLTEGAQRGLVSKLMLSDARQQVTAVEERQSELASRSASAEDQISTLQAEMASVDAEFTQNISIELGKTTELWRELQAEERALAQRSARFEIKAPVAGVVMNLPLTKENAVIAPGGVVADIVPANQAVVMEVMVTPRDIGFIQVGQKAVVKVDAFDYSRFGSVAGKVKRVSPTSIKLKENGATFYKVQVSLDNPYIGSSERLITAGMTGEADIVTGRKSVIQYLLKPIFLTADTAFHER